MLEGIRVGGPMVVEVWGGLAATARARPPAGVEELDEGRSGTLVVAVALVDMRLSAVLFSVVVDLAAVVSVCCPVSRGVVPVGTVSGLADSEPVASE